MSREIETLEAKIKVTEMHRDNAKSNLHNIPKWSSKEHLQEIIDTAESMISSYESEIAEIKKNEL